ncbi:MAG: hypothetical protein M1813_009284 [Trichoglossum hirsutum]|nr:MAG: hypothetical protein M1813_009284 [Trichoglossum hirsutum]
MPNVFTLAEASSTPTYILRPVPSLVNGISDIHLSLIIAVVVYWATALIFQIIESAGFFQNYRMHTSAEELARNRVSRWECIRQVVLNQVIQTCLGIGLGMLGNGDFTGREDYDVAVWAKRLRVLRRILSGITGIDTSSLTKKVACYWLNDPGKGCPQARIDDLFASWDITSGEAVYWYIVPALQFAVAIFAADTWQYFGHRFEHLNRWVYSMLAVSLGQVKWHC